MSSIFGIYHRDKRPVNSCHLEKMADSTAHRGPAGSNIFLNGHIGLGQCMLQTTPESLHEVLPFADRKSGMIITADARIDNREDLAEKLHIHNISNIPDSQFILYAFQKWGLDSFPQLRGDFSFTIWDSRNNRLVCVRDFIGVRPFYYHNSPTQFIFSSEIKQLAEYPEISLSVNEAMAGEYLACSFTSKTETLFYEINRLAAGHYLVVEPDRITSGRYWDCKPKKLIYYKNTSEYTSHFLEIFSNAVESRLRSNEPISAELSGGIDSSSVVGMATRLLRKKNGSKLQAYSLIFPEMPFDEKTYIDAVKKYLNVPVTFINGLEHNYNSITKQATRTFEPPDVPNLTLTTPLLTAVRENNSRVVLTGVGGDDCFTGSGYPYLDFIKRGKLISLFKELQFDSINTTRFHAWKKLSVNLLWPLAPHFIRYRLTYGSCQAKLPPWLTDDFVKRVHLLERIHQAHPRLRLSNLGKTVPLTGLGASKQYALESIDRHRSLQHIEARHPFLDQRIVEFALSIPDYESRRLGQIKFLLCQTNNSLLPSIIRSRRKKAEFSYLINKTFENTLFPLDLSQLSICKPGWIDTSILGTHVAIKKQMINRDQYTKGQKTWELWFAYAINLWYSQLKKV